MAKYPFVLKAHARVYPLSISANFDKHIKDVVERTANACASDISIKSPRLYGRYSSSWTYDTHTSDNKQTYIGTVYNSERYWLTHLLEFGHMSKDHSKFIGPYPHITPSYNHFRDVFLRSL
jgi:hypothetical protein